MKTQESMRIRIVKALALTILAIFSGLEASANKAEAQSYSPMTISGTVWTAPTSGHTPTNIPIYDPDGNIFLGSTTTNSNGEYSITVLPVGLEDKINPNTDMTVLGNPITTEANLELTVLNQDNYNVRVFDVSGLQLFNQRVSLAEGNNKITLSGLGAPGLKIVEVSDGKKKYVAKVLQTGSSDFSPSISSTAMSGRTGVLKSSNYTTQLEIHFNPIDPGYESNIKIVPAMTQTVNDTVWGVQNTINKTLHVFDVHGMSIKPGASSISSYFTLNVQFKDGTILPFAASNGDITINRVEYYPNISDVLKFLPDIISNPHFTNEMIVRQIHQPRYIANIAQTTDPSAYDPIDVIVANMPTESQLYLIPSKVLNPMTMTDSIWTKSHTCRDLLTYLPSDAMSKFVDVTTSRPLYIIINTWDAYNNQQMPTVQLDRMENEIRKQSDVIPFLANSDSLLPVFIITRETSYNSTIWQQIINRGSNQFLEAQYWSGMQPGAGVVLTTNGSYNGNEIIKASSINVNPSNSNGTIGEEFGHGMWDKPDPAGGLGLEGYIYNNDGVTISDFWKVNVRIGLLYDPGVAPLKSANNGEKTFYFDGDKK